MGRYIYGLITLLYAYTIICAASLLLLSCILSFPLLNLTSPQHHNYILPHLGTKNIMHLSIKLYRSVPFLIEKQVPLII
jgi:ABC-type methionine transport system permease subunit